MVRTNGVIILESALRHGVLEDDMLHAVRHCVAMIRQEDGSDVFVGPARPGHPLLEVSVTVWYGAIAINHAMPARRKYLRWKK